MSDPLDSRPLLVVIDMQRVFAEPGSPWYVPDFPRLVAPIERLVAAFGARVVFTRFVVPEVPEGSWREYYEAWSFAREPEAASLFELADPWSRREPRVVSKTTFSAFGPELHALAGAKNTLVLCGVSTECCVLATALDAVDAGVCVRIVTDACASVDRETHECALRVATTGFSPVIGLTIVETEVERLGERAFKP
jgi:nicotinamidase-related amidase